MKKGIVVFMVLLSGATTGGVMWSRRQEPKEKPANPKPHILTEAIMIYPSEPGEDWSTAWSWKSEVKWPDNPEGPLRARIARYGGLAFHRRDPAIELPATGYVFISTDETNVSGLVLLLSTLRRDLEPREGIPLGAKQAITKRGEGRLSIAVPLKLFNPAGGETSVSKISLVNKDETGGGDVNLAVHEVALRPVEDIAGLLVSGRGEGAQ